MPDLTRIATEIAVEALVDERDTWANSMQQTSTSMSDRPSEGGPDGG